MSIGRILTFFVMVAYALSLLSGCGRNNVNDTSATGGDQERLKITWLGPPYNPSAVSGAFSQRLLEEKFNIEIEPIFMDSNAYKTKKPILFSSGEIPDIIYELDPINVQQDVGQGFLAEIPYEKIMQMAPTMLANINAEAPQAWLYSYSNGRNYGIPNVLLTGSDPRLGMWRMDWLKKVGITKVPETLDEMHKAFTAFANQDPDGNGKKDTYGMSGDISNTHTTFTEIFGAFGVIPFGWMRQDDKVVYGGVVQETKRALQLLANWYQEGLIDPDFITDNYQKSGMEKFQNSKVGYTNAGATYTILDKSLPNTVTQINSDAELVPSFPPKGPEGKAGSYVWGNAAHVIAFGKQLEKQSAKLTRIMSMLEYMQTDQDFSIRLRIGDENVHWKYKDPAKGIAGGFDALPPYDDPAQLENAVLLSPRSVDAFVFFAPVTISRATAEKYMDPIRKEFSDKYMDKAYGISDVFLKPDVVPSASKYYNDLKKKQATAMATIIMGDKPLDHYDDFIAEWFSQGGATLTQDANELYNTMGDIYTLLNQGV